MTDQLTKTRVHIRTHTVALTTSEIEYIRTEIRPPPVFMIETILLEAMK